MNKRRLWKNESLHYRSEFHQIFARFRFELEIILIFARDIVTQIRRFE